MNVFHLSLLSIFIIFACACDKDLSIDDVATDDDAICRTTEQGTFKINLDPNDCTINIEQQLNITSQYEEQIEGNTRQISVNGIASHKVGEFPSRGNPNTISSHNANLSMSTTPQLASNTTPASGYTLGVLFSGITIEPFTAEFYRTSTGGFNRDWNITTLTSAVNLGLDCNNAHVQPTGKYHYHGTPSAYIAQLEGNDGSQMLKIGYAGDGFPIYYKYGYDENETQIIALSSGYQLRAGSRTGDGETAPDGCYDGTYFADYEYVAGVSLLDECNGRFGKTPNAPEGEYYYVMTDNFPSAPLCFSGTPDASFRNRR